MRERTTHVRKFVHIWYIFITFIFSSSSSRPLPSLLSTAAAASLVSLVTLHAFSLRIFIPWFITRICFLSAFLPFTTRIQKYTDTHFRAFLWNLHFTNYDRIWFSYGNFHRSHFSLSAFFPFFFFLRAVGSIYSSCVNVLCVRTKCAKCIIHFLLQLSLETLAASCIPSTYLVY